MVHQNNDNLAQCCNTSPLALPPTPPSPLESGFPLAYEHSVLLRLPLGVPRGRRFSLWSGWLIPAARVTSSLQIQGSVHSPLTALPALGSSGGTSWNQRKTGDWGVVNLQPLSSPKCSSGQAWTHWGRKQHALPPPAQCWHHKLPGTSFVLSLLSRPSLSLVPLDGSFGPLQLKI